MDELCHLRGLKWGVSTSATGASDSTHWRHRSPGLVLDFHVRDKMPGAIRVIKGSLGSPDVRWRLWFESGASEGRKQGQVAWTSRPFPNLEIRSIS